MPNYNVFLHRVFSVQRLLGGILTILLTGSIVAGCTMSAGRGGLYFLIIAIPMVGIGFGLISKPYRLVCRTCNVKVDKKAQGAPFQSLLNGSLQAVAQSGDPGHLDHILRNAPLPDSPPAPFCMLLPLLCPVCGSAGYLQVITYTTSEMKAGAVPGPTIDKVVTEFGAEIGPQQIQMLAQGAAGRWAATKEQRGFGDPEEGRP